MTVDRASGKSLLDPKEPTTDRDHALSPTRRWLAVAALLGATFVGTINNSIVNVAVPSISHDLDIGLSTSVWVISGFVLAVGTLMPLAGRIGDMYGPRRVFLWGTLLFAAASLIVATGPNIAVVITGRVLQGVAGAPVLPCILATIRRLFPPATRGMAVGLWAAVNSAALAAGPAVGGLIVDSLGWRAIFYLSAPAILVVGGLVALLVPRDLPTTPRRLDVVGAVLVVVVLASLTIPITEGSVWGWTSGRTMGFVAVCGVSFLLLRSHLRRAAEPFISLDLIRQPSYALLTLVASLQMVVLFAVTLAVPVFFLLGAGFTAGAAGLVTSILPASMFFGALFSGYLTTRAPLPVLLTTGGAAMVLGSGLIGFLAPSALGAAAGLLVVGAGISLIQAPSAAAVTSVAPADQTGVAAGLFNTARFVFGGLGAALAAVVFSVVAGSLHASALPPADALAGLRAALSLGVVPGLLIMLLAHRVRPGTRSVERDGAPR